MTSLNLSRIAHLPKFDLKRINLGKIARSLLSQLHQSTELQVWQEFDQAEHCFWNAYDPITQRSIYGISEAEMRVWIEQRNQ
ncbi:MAG: hypothetical protein NW224_23730 [Leptolyngbyaceae cyanobacterium bins.302]|nr:hypothetical protein [Leptolyngbyaceae cyanobacterium bins.302]